MAATLNRSPALTCLYFRLSKPDSRTNGEDMRSSRRIRALFATGITAVLLVAMPGGAAAERAASPAAVPDRAPAGKTEIVTLITGDRVSVHGDGRLGVAPRKGVTFHSYRTPGHQYVIPSDALPLLAADRLDRRLFDVTELLAVKETKRAALPLIVAGAATAPGLTPERRLPAVKGFTAEIAVESLATKWQSTRSGLAKGKIWLDGVRRPALDVSVPLIGAPTAWSAGYDGTGVTVAVLDTGIDATHPDLAGKIAAQRNFTEEYEDDLDHVGHGTHVASTIAGSGAGSGGKYRGVAPGASLLDGKVCVEGGCAESWILAGMQWAAESGADVVNMSLGGQNTPEVDPLEQAVDDLTAQHGTLFVISAGNSGSDGSVGSPSTAASALSVAAFTKTDELADFSSRGPSADGYAVKPEIAAPGVEIVAARSKDGFLGEPGELYMPLDGTSMAAPHITGAAALLTQVHPQWTAAQRKAALMASAKPGAGIGVFAQGAGRVDVARAITQQITTSPAAVTFGLQEWPHGDDEVRTSTVTYHNGGAAAVTLQLALTGAEPAGIFSLSADTVTVPAGGDASVTLTADTRQGGDVTGGLGGQLTATAAGVSVQTPFAVVREELKHAVHVKATERDGDPAVDAITVVLSPTTWQEYVLYGAEGDLRLPPGDYFAWSWVHEGGEGDFSVTQLTYPKLTVGGELDLAFDARGAASFDVTIPEPDAKAVMASFDVNLAGEDFGLGVGIMGDTFGSMYSKALGPQSVPGLSSQLTGTLAELDEEGSPLASPYVYNVGWWSEGILEGFTKHLRTRDFATVKGDYAQTVKGTTGLVLNFLAPEGGGGGWATGWSTPLPFLRTDYFAGNAPWNTELMEEIPVEGEPWPETISDYAQVRTLEAGRTYHEKWNRGVFGPTTASFVPSRPNSFRDGDQLQVAVPMLGDGQGRVGFTLISDARGALYRNGELIQENEDTFVWLEDADPASAKYRFEASVARDARTSTKVSAKWTFRSGRTGTMTELPLTSISFAPHLDAHNVAKAGGVSVFPLTVRRAATSGQVAKLSVQVSYDGGKTWAKAPVLHLGSSWLLAVHHPKKGGFVSLRAASTDTHGNTVEQTIIRAYEIR